MITKWFKKQKKKFYTSFGKRLYQYGALSAESFKQKEEKEMKEQLFQMLLLSAARNIAADYDFRRIPMLTPVPPAYDFKTIKIGFYGNIANNHYVIVKALRRLGYQGELVVEDNFFDNFLLNKPFWEDLNIACNSYDEGLLAEDQWQQPCHVLRVAFDMDLQIKYAGRLSAISEVQALYQEAFGMPICADRALLLAQHMGHWPYLLSMRRYDIIQFCNAPIQLAPFCPKPYLILPAGGELRFTAFEETLQGLLTRAGFRNASTVINGDTGFVKYLSRLGIQEYSPIRWLIQEDLYPVEPDLALREQWRTLIGGDYFILMACRQVWADKGNDLFIRSFGQIIEQFPDWRLILLHWGSDIGRTKALIQELSLTDKVHWMPLLSKPLLRKYQASADWVVDHCLDFGVGATPIESMSAGTPVLIRQNGQYENFIWGGHTPPLITFKTLPELPRILWHYMSQPELLLEKGKESRQWVETHLSYKDTISFHIEAYKKALFHG